MLITEGMIHEINFSFLSFFKNNLFLFIDFRERGKKGERERQREKHQFVIPLM